MTVARRDLLLGLGAAALVQGELALTPGLSAGTRLVTAGSALAALGLAWHRHHPTAVVGVLVAALLAQAAAGGALTSELGSPLPVLAFACFALGRHERRLGWVLAGVAAVAGGLTVANQLDPDLTYPVLDDLVFFGLFAAAAAAVGWTLRERADVIAALRERGEALRAARTDAAAAVLAEERARLAVALHDALAQRIGELSLQAAGAERLAVADPPRTRAALARIETGARAALDDIRALLGVLRRSEERLGLVPHHRRPPEPPRLSPVESTGALQAVPAVARAGGWRRLEGRGGRGGRLAVAGPVLPAVVVGVAMAIETLTSDLRSGPVALNLVGLGAVAAPLAWRRTRPLTATVVALGVLALHSIWLTPLGSLVTPLALLVVLPYSLGAHLPRRRALAGLLLCVVASLPTGEIPPGLLVIIAVAWGAGRVVRDRGERARALRDVVGELELASEAHADRVREEERLRVARELHDAVAHSMTVIVLQAEAAQRVWSSDPSAAREAVRHLGRVARETLAELRVSLRDLDPGGIGLQALEGLVERMRPLGLEVRLLREDAPGGLPAEVDRVGYRVVQEALTNAARYAAPTAVDVRVRCEDGTLRIDVVDAGRAPGDRRPGLVGSGSGSGLDGMRERVAACNGELRYGFFGPGFGVHASLPGGNDAVTVRILIADDQDLVRAGLRMLIDAEDDLEVVGEAPDGEQAVAAARRLSPDLVLMDIRMPHLDGVAATRAVLAGDSGTQPAPRVLMLTTFDRNEYVYDAIQAGASGFLLKDMPGAQLVAGLRSVAAGDALLAPAVTRRLIEDFASIRHRPAPPGLAELTARERETFGLVARGLSNAEIAAELTVSEATVKTHVAHMLAKLDLRDRVQAVVLAYETGLVRPGAS